MSASPPSTVYLLDVDNTLLDNDRVVDDLHAFLKREFGGACRDQFAAILEERRATLGYVDYLGTLQEWRRQQPMDMRLMSVSHFLLRYSFASKLYPQALEVVSHLGRSGRTVILSDGDVVFQPYKVARAGLASAVDQRVLIYVHKEAMLDDVARRHPADHYVLIDDKPRIAAAVKQRWGDRVTTILPRQGHYANAADAASHRPAADIVVERIGDMLDLELGRSTGC
ncbi:MAG: HAD family hydrolase [Phycisphaerales bacterium]|nr:HAD family hydrolase [Phycisphaerales bacterium]